MSTKGLMAHKKVAEVTLNDAGKAATLTLAAPWLYNGERGPFTLNNVEHGHQIVKGATSDGSAAPAPKPRSPRATESGDNPAEQSLERRKPLGHLVGALSKPRTHEVWVYRLILANDNLPHDGTGHAHIRPATKGQEICGWLQITHALGSLALKVRTHEMLDAYVPKGSDPGDWVVESFRWTQKMQDAARKAGDGGSPWAGVNHG